MEGTLIQEWQTKTMYLPLFYNLVPWLILTFYNIVLGDIPHLGSM